MPPVINKEKCKACGICADVCPMDVFFGTKKGEFPVITYPEECWHEGACVQECPIEGVIKLRIPLQMMICYK
ncbi:4Fe-4S dicluster domain-containing protein [Moorella sulfitireducens]|uniref:4Fe-4S dicluster domain-containing protein n=1 Tax=Neomoorella sulfitireducens TaxID=2972948 RepID=UPI0021AD22A7|nr:ferredoxin family protein [Moorella sulfitireducens]